MDDKQLRDDEVTIALETEVPLSPLAPRAMRAFLEDGLNTVGERPLESAQLLLSEVLSMSVRLHTAAGHSPADRDHRELAGASDRGREPRMGRRGSSVHGVGRATRPTSDSCCSPTSPTAGASTRAAGAPSSGSSWNSADGAERRHRGLDPLERPFPPEEREGLR